MMIIEFVGPPGAGKTTIAQELGRLVGLPSVTLDGYRTGSGRLLSQREVSFSRWSSLVTQPRLATEALRCLRREGRGLALSWVVNLARRNRMMRSLEHDIILEEGTLSALCLAKAARKHPWDMQAVCDWLSYGSAVIVVNADTETAVERIKARKGILADRGEEELRDLVSRYNSALSELTTMMRPAPLSVLSDRSPQAVAAHLGEVLMKKGTE